MNDHYCRALLRRWDFGQWVNRGSRQAEAWAPAICVLLAVAFGGMICRGEEPLAASDPGTCLYDVPSTDASEQWLAKKSGWLPLAEEDTAHRFQGAAVVINDKIVAVLPRSALEVRLYSRQTEGLKLCAELCPLCGGAELRRTGLAIRENNRSTVSLEVAFESATSGPCRITYELTAGAPFLKTTAGPRVDSLRVSAPCRFAVLPDFFGDDMLVDAEAMPTLSRTDLPCDNFLLHMMHGGEAVAMTVSEARDSDVAVTLAKGRIVASEIPYAKRPHIWVAVLAGKGIWHEQAIAPADADRVIPLGWKMPFAALWRVNWSTEDKMTDSWEMMLARPDGNYAMLGWFGQDESKGQRFGREFGDRDWNKPGRKRWNPVLGGFSFPCWADRDGRGYLQPLKQRRYTEGGKVHNFAGPAVLYPINRAKTQPFHTPINRLTVVDLVRLTLGIGPCEYILDLEGQKRNSQGVATCYARDVINAIYQQRVQLKKRAEIEEHLAAAVAFIRNVRQRIDLYQHFGREMAAYLEEQRRLAPRTAPFVDELLPIVKRLDELYQQNRQQIRTPSDAEQAARDFREKLLTYTETDAYGKCAAQMAVFTSIGGAQDGLVASCRMIVKTLRQRAGMAMAADPDLKAVAREIRARTQTVLRNPTPYEAPRH